MSKKSENGNIAGQWAPLSNIMLASETMDRLINRSKNLPGIATFHGFSGYGKSMAAAFCANKHGAAYVECRSIETKKSFLESICKEIALRPGRTSSESFDLIVGELGLSHKPLIIDESDKIVDTKLIELVRDIYEASRCPILLIGEESLPKKLEANERFHNRVLIWQPAAPASERDVRELAKYYAPNITIEPDLLKLIAERSRHVVRRICVNIDMVREAAQTRGIKVMNAANWEKEGQAFYTGETPMRRAK